MRVPFLAIIAVVLSPLVAAQWVKGFECAPHICPPIDNSSMDYMDGAYHDVGFYTVVMYGWDRSKPIEVTVDLDFESLRSGHFTEAFPPEAIQVAKDPSEIQGPFYWSEGIFESAEFILIELKCGVSVIQSATLRSDSHVETYVMTAEEVCAGLPVTAPAEPMVAVAG